MKRERRPSGRDQNFGISPSASAKRIRCGNCPPCLAEDCGKCDHCARKKKFGCAGTSRQPCILRRCVLIHGDLTDGVQQHVHQMKPTPLNPPSVIQRKEPPGQPSRARRASGDGQNKHADLESCSDTNGKGNLTLSSRKKPAKRPFPLVSKLETSLFPVGTGEDKKTMEPLDKKACDESCYRRVFGKKIPVPPVIGACAVCGDDSSSETVLLCDGKDCEREYHLSCASLKDVPSGDWFCVDCHPIGSGAEALLNYLEQMDERRSDYLHSTAFVQALLEGDEGKIDRVAFVSELEKAKILSSVEAAVRLVGKPIWMRVPKVDDHVPGRIVDHRLVATSDPDIMEHAFLVRFAAGHYNRKETFHHWIFLEEHQLMVGHRFVMAKKTGNSRQQPGLMYLRTKRELVADLFLTKTKIAIRNRRSNCSLPSSGYRSSSNVTGSPSRVRSSGEKKAKEIQSTKDSAPRQDENNQSKQALVVRFFGQVGDKKFELIDSPHDAVSSPDGDKPILADFDILGDPSSKDLQWHELAAALVEKEEQERVCAWRSIPEGNPFHPSGLKSLDYFRLNPLIIQNDTKEGGCTTRYGAITAETNMVETSGELHTQLCPLVPSGIDHHHVLNILQQQTNSGTCHSKEAAASLSCSIVPYKWRSYPSIENGG